MAAIQAQIQALLIGGVREQVRREEGRGGGVEVAKPQIFDGTSAKVGGFITACRLFLRMKLREAMVEKQVQWVLSYVQGESTDVWKKNVMEELESVKVEYHK